MGKPKRRRNANTYKNSQRKADPVRMELPKEDDGTPIRDSLFRPMTFKSRGDRTVDFDHVMVPFLIKDGLVFALSFMDGCGDVSSYVECFEMDGDKSYGSYRDAVDLMRECLEVQRLTGTPYYFGKLDKAIDRYLYSLELFVERGFLENGMALELAGLLGFGSEDLEGAFRTVSFDVDASRRQREAMLGQKAAADAFMQFVDSMLGNHSDGDGGPAEQAEDVDSAAESEG